MATKEKKASASAAEAGQHIVLQVGANPGDLSGRLGEYSIILPPYQVETGDPQKPKEWRDGGTVVIKSGTMWMPLEVWQRLKPHLMHTDPDQANAITEVCLAKDLSQQPVAVLSSLARGGWNQEFLNLMAASDKPQVARAAAQRIQELNALNSDSFTLKPVEGLL